MDESKILIGNLDSTSKLISTLSEIEDAMERWHHARDNNEETLESINNILYDAGMLWWFNQK
jgi:hypothetical protein